MFEKTRRNSITAYFSYAQTRSPESSYRVNPGGANATRLVLYSPSAVAVASIFSVAILIQNYKIRLSVNFACILQCQRGLSCNVCPVVRQIVLRIRKSFHDLGRKPKGWDGIVCLSIRRKRIAVEEKQEKRATTPVRRGASLVSFVYFHAY